jgi:hypothetical protein
MQTFTDNQGTTWNFHLTWGKAEKIHLLCERPSSTPENRKTYDLFNLNDLVDRSQIDDLQIDDPLTGRFLLENAKCLINVFYVICEEQCTERGISGEQFGAMLTSPAVFHKANNAFREELVNFIPNPEHQGIFKKMLSLVDERRTLALSETNRILDEKIAVLDAKTTQILQTQMDQVDQMINESFQNVTKRPVESGTISSLRILPPSTGVPIT